MANKIKATHNLVFKTPDGRMVLGNLLHGPCRFFGRLGEQDDVTDAEMYVRQQAGREILWSMGLMPGPGNDMTPDRFVNMLMNVYEPPSSWFSRWFRRKEKKNAG